MLLAQVQPYYVTTFLAANNELRNFRKQLAKTLNVSFKFNLKGPAVRFMT